MQNVKVTLSPDQPQLKHNLTIIIDADLSECLYNAVSILCVANY